MENITTNNFDKITIELMCNRKQYSKILSKTNPKKFEETREHLTKIKNYSTNIMNLTEELLNNPDTQITNEINNAFEEYSKICIRYFEMKEYENKYNPYDNGKDEDILFNETLMSHSSTLEFNASDSSATPLHLQNNIDNTLPMISKSFWGKSINKIN